MNLNEDWASIHPRDAIEVWQPTFLSSLDMQIVAQLYQPFIGTVATSLYQYLAYEINLRSFHSEVFQLDSLLASLNIGIPAYYHARTRLEGIGLIKTFEKKLESNTNCRFELYAPVQPKDFFKDALLSTLLINQVGHRRYEQLRNRFVVAQREEGWEEVSMSFSHVFATPSNVTKFDYKQAQQRAVITKSESHAPELESDALDWKYLEKLLSSQFIHANALNDRIKKILTTLHAYCRLSEEEIVSYVLYATDLTTKMIDEEKLFEVVLESNEQLQRNQVNKTKTAPAQSLAHTTKNQSEQTDARSTETFNEQIEQLIQLAESLSPLDFIYAIKKQRNGFVEKNEQKIILDVLEMSQLPPAVVNILIHYFLIVKDYSSLWKEATESIANKWSQEGVKTARAAIECVQQYNLTKQNKKTAAFNKNKQGATYQKVAQRSSYRPRVEKMPAWSQKDPLEQETPLEGEELQKLQERIAKLKTTQNQQKRGDS